jgi:rhamnosyltransferase
MKFTVTILLSSFNGEQFICDQIDSILAQEGVNVSIVVRDDGSTDSTLKVLSRYNGIPNVKVLECSNVGVTKSFNDLCLYALKHTDTDYYAFCDQDDVWDSNKLDVAVSKLRQFPDTMPNLYFSNLKIVDENLAYIRNLFQPGEVVIGPHMAMIQIFTYGCTCVFNRQALIDYCSCDNQICHDHWVYELCTYMGNVYYDSDSYINYRQHGNNVSGNKPTSFLGWLNLRIHKLYKTGLHHNFEVKARQLLRFKKRITDDNFRYICKIAYYRVNIKYKLSLLFSRDYGTRDAFKNFTIKCRILTNRL